MRKLLSCVAFVLVAVLLIAVIPAADKSPPDQEQVELIDYAAEMDMVLYQHLAPDRSEAYHLFNYIYIDDIITKSPVTSPDPVLILDTRFLSYWQME